MKAGFNDTDRCRRCGADTNFRVDLCKRCYESVNNAKSQPAASQPRNRWTHFTDEELALARKRRAQFKTWKEIATELGCTVGGLRKAVER